MTSKTLHFLETIESNPGITTAELHRRIGGSYAHGHHKFTYETVARMIRNKLIVRCTPADGLRGAGLRVPQTFLPIRFVHADKSVSTIGC